MLSSRDPSSDNLPFPFTNPHANPSSIPQVVYRSHNIPLSPFTPSETTLSKTQNLQAAAQPR
ncbi:unnamed protein product [Periconia digitata]|uniref:Uncharacterized protein n=1 Tax=Periconia digitata TaxID=1303443 RepID=A0A9W4U434_9PLEO|nr:unnamed protein product [Periconia digitata]